MLQRYRINVKMSGQEFPDSEFVTWQSRRDECAPDLRFLHYNDVYHIEYVAIRESPVSSILLPTKKSY